MLIDYGSTPPVATLNPAPERRAHKNVVVVALAAKLARIAWAVLRRGRAFDALAAAA